jgi:NADPH:quinone reductase-like Zn-dependent oxidoreductase
MRGMALQKYGSFANFQLTNLPDPVAGNGEVLVRVHAASLNPADYKVALGIFKLLHARNFPMILGYDFSGVVEAVGSECGTFKVGDAVFGFLPYSFSNRRGSFAELVVARADEIALKPERLSHIDAAAAATSGITALQSLRDLGKVTKGQRVLITGVSGGVGSMAVCVAQQLGAQVVAIGSGSGLELAKKLGAVQTIDRSNKDLFANDIGAFDVVFDCAAAYSWSMFKSKLKPGGTYVTLLPSLSFMKDKVLSLFAKSRARFLSGCKSRGADLKILADMLESGMPVTLDSTIPIHDIAKGLEKLQSGKVLGKIAVKVADG